MRLLGSTLIGYMAGLLSFAILSLVNIAFPVNVMLAIGFSVMVGINAFVGEWRELG